MGNWRSSAVKIIESDSKFRSEITNARDKRVIVSFTASRCEAYQQVAPKFQALSMKYTSAIFLEVDVDACKESCRRYDVATVPMFILLYESVKLDEMKGSDVKALEDKIKRWTDYDEEELRNMSRTVSQTIYKRNAFTLDYKVVHQDLGDLEQAKENYEYYLATIIETLGSNHVDVARTYADLGFVHEQLGDLQQAKEYYERSLDIRIKLLGSNHVDVAMSYDNLGRVHKQLGDLQQAKEYHERSRDILIKLLGSNHVDVARTYDNLGIVHGRLGDLQQAKEYFERSLGIRIKLLGCNHVDVARTYDNLGVVHQQLGDLQQAKEYHELSLDIRIKLLGSNNVDVAWTYDNLGVVHRQLGDLQQAKEYYERSLDVRIKLLGSNNVHVAWTYDNLGVVHRQLGDLQQAKEHHERSLDVRIKLLGSNHVDVARTYNNLGIVHGQLGDLQQAKEHHERSLDIRIKLLGSNHVDVAMTYNNLGIVHRQLGDLKQAKEHHERSLDIRIKLLGSNHVDVARTYNNLGIIHQQLGDLKEAKEHHERSLDIRIKLLGSNHVDVARTYNYLGIVHQQLGDLQQAQEHHERSRDIRIKLLGSNHVDVARTYDKLGIVHRQLGDLQQAQEYLERDTADVDDKVEELQQQINFSVGDKEEVIAFPAGSVFIKFPAQTVSKPVTLTCKRVTYQDCPVKPRKGEVFCSSIIELQPENFIFDKPVTVLLSHSASVDGAYADYYDLTVQKLEKTCEDLETERLTQSEDLPKELVSDFCDIRRYLPLAKVTIDRTCTLVVTSRIRSEEIVVQPDEMYDYTAFYGNESELEIFFPFGSVTTECVLTIQVIPPIDALDVKENGELVCFPVIKVSGRDEPFLKPFKVDLCYTSDGVAAIDENFLPVGKKLPFSSKYGVLFYSHKNLEENLVCQKADTSNSMIERCQKNQLKISFSASKFSKRGAAVKTKEDFDVNDTDNLEESGIRFREEESPSVVAVCLATTQTTRNSGQKLYALLAPLHKRNEMKASWGSVGEILNRPIGYNEIYYYCVLLSEQQHLKIPDNIITLFKDTINPQFNIVDRDENVIGRLMRFTSDECTSQEHPRDNIVGKCQIIVNGWSFMQWLRSLPSKMRPHSELDTPGVTVAVSNVSSEHLVDMKTRCELFEKEFECHCEELLAKRRDKESKFYKVVNSVGTITGILVNIGCGIAIAMTFPTFGIASFVAAAIAAGGLVVTKIVKNKHKKLDRISERLETFSDTLILSLFKEVGQELSRMFEDQLFRLKDKRDVKTMACCAVKSMFNLKDGEKFTRNNLLKKVISGKTSRQHLKTKRSNITWQIPDVFQKPGLRKEAATSSPEEPKKIQVKFEYLKKPDDTCDPESYGYRGQILEMVCDNSESVDSELEEKDGCSEELQRNNNVCTFCSSSNEDSTATYFKESEIDRQYTENCSESSQYQPYHCLMQCPGILESVPLGLTLKNHVSEMYFSVQNKPVKPVYRSHSPRTVRSLCNADLNGSDFSRVHFTNCRLEKCVFTDCTILFGQLKEVNLRGSCFQNSHLSYCNLVSAQAQRCQWTTTKVLYCCLDNADLRDGVNTIGGNDWTGSNLEKASIRNPPEIAEEIVETRRNGCPSPNSMPTPSPDATTETFPNPSGYSGETKHGAWECSRCFVLVGVLVGIVSVLISFLITNRFY